MRTDKVLDADYNVAEADSEWTEGDSTVDDVDLLLQVGKGEIPQYPFAGFGMESRIKSRIDERRFLRELEIELENDGFSNPEIDITNGIENIKINIHETN